MVGIGNCVPTSSPGWPKNNVHVKFSKLFEVVFVEMRETKYQRAHLIK